MDPGAAGATLRNAAAPPSSTGGGGAGAVVALAWLSQVALALLLTVAMGRTLDATAFGLFALAAASLGFAREAADLGSTVAAARSMGPGPQHEGPVLLGLVVLRAAVGAVAAAAALGAAALAPTEAARAVALAIAAALLLLPCGAFQALFLARQRQLGVALWGAGTQLVVLAVCLGLVAAAVPGWAVALAVVAREAVWMLGLGALGWRLSGPLPPWASAAAAAKAVLGAVGLWAVAALLRHVLSQIELMAVTLAWGAAEAGAWSAAARLLAPVAALTVALTAPLVPALSRAQPGQAGELVSAALLAAVVPALLLASAGVAVAGEGVAWLYAGAWGGPGGPVAALLALLAASLVPLVVGTVAGLALLGLHREPWVVAVLAPAVVLKTAACLLWVPSAGAWGAGVIAMVAECLIAAALLHALRQAARRNGQALRATAADGVACGAAALGPALVALAWPLDGGSRVLVAALAVLAGAGLAWHLRPGRRLREAWRTVHPAIEGRPPQRPH